MLRPVPGEHPDPTAPLKAQPPGAAKVKHISNLYSGRGAVGGEREDK